MIHPVGKDCQKKEKYSEAKQYLQRQRRIDIINFGKHDLAPIHVMYTNTGPIISLQHYVLQSL